MPICQWILINLIQPRPKMVRYSRISLKPFKMRSSPRNRKAIEDIHASYLEIENTRPEMNGQQTFEPRAASVVSNH
jgi:hypothetical protein